jgi:hypothetical protein
MFHKGVPPSFYGLFGYNNKKKKEKQLTWIVQPIPSLS